MHKDKPDLISTRSWLLIFTACLGLMLYIILAKAPVKPYSILNRSWGFDQLMYYSSEVRISGLLFIVALLLPFINSRFIGFLLQLQQAISKLKGLWGILLISMLVSLIFYLLQVRYFFLGDFNLRMIQVMKQDFVNEEYLTMFSLYHLATFFSRFGVGDEGFFRLYSVVMGFFYVMLSQLIAREAGRNATEKLLIALLLVGTSTVLLFCGYVEIYSTPAVLMMLFFYAGLRYIRLKGGFVFVILSFVLAVASHLLSIALLPAMLVVYYSVQQNSFRFLRRFSQRQLIMGMVVAAAAALLALFAKGHPFLMPVKQHGAPGRMTLMSIPHLWEFFNGLVLCSGVAIIICLILFARMMRSHQALSPRSAFALAAAACIMLLLFISDLQRGSGDWDLMSFIAPPLLLSTAFLIFDTEGQGQNRYYPLVFLFGFNLLNAGLWLHINHTKLSVKKIESMLDGDPASYYEARMSGKMQLAFMFKGNKLYREEEAIARKACEEAPLNDNRACLLVAEVLANTNREDDAMVFSENLLRERSDAIYEPYIFLLQYYKKRNQAEKVLDCLNRMYNAFVKNPNAFVQSPNFDKTIVSGLFTGLYKTEIQYSTDYARLNQMKNLAQEILAWNPPTNP